MWALTYRFVRKHVKIENGLLVDVLSYLILAAISVAMIGQVSGRYIYCPILAALLVLLYLRDVRVIVSKLSSMVKSRKNGNG